MPITAATVASYAPWGNAQLSFQLDSGAAATDPETGNTVQATETVDYLASLNLESPQWQGKPGADETLYRCRGRVLVPDHLDPRITNGSQAEATVNGYRGRFEVVFDLSQDAFHRSALRQSLQGTLRIVGGPDV